MTEKGFILSLILEEEEKNNTDNRQNPSENIQNSDNNNSSKNTREGRATLEQTREEEKDFVFIEERNVTFKPGVFNKPAAEDELGDIEELPVHQDGTLVDAVVIAEDSNFALKVEIDEHDIIDDTYSYISDVSTELSKVGAYQTSNGNYLVHVTDYDFNERLDVGIRPQNENIEFKLIRIEAER